MTGRSCEDAEKADQICQALSSGNNATVQCGGFTWYATGARAPIEPRQRAAIGGS